MMYSFLILIYVFDEKRCYWILLNISYKNSSLLLFIFYLFSPDYIREYYVQTIIDDYFFIRID